LVENSYFKDVIEGIKTTLSGLKISMKHFKKARQSMSTQDIQDPNYFNYSGVVTLQYPHESIPVPDNGRYRLDNEMDDCIVCDKCAKVCPVDCIDIEPIKATEQVGVTSDGSPIRLYAAKFDIDMAKCCFCGLCTTVCPTECLTMSKAYDFSEFNVLDFNYHYANLSPEQAQEKKELYQQFVAEKEAAKQVKPTVAETLEEKPVVARPSFKPTFKKPDTSTTEIVPDSKPIATKPLFKPTFKKAETELPSETATENIPIGEEPPKPVAARPTFKPVFKKPVTTDSASNTEGTSPVETTNITNEVGVNGEENEAKSLLETASQTPKAANRPVFKPVFKKPEREKSLENTEGPSPKNTEQISSSAAKKPVFKPVYKKPETVTDIDQSVNTVSQEIKVEEPKPVEEKPKPKFVPKFKKPE
jgi:formate hydrogenlyase subunit 6/NADH:ubiquinone oxidoreductase subunit I